MLVRIALVLAAALLVVLTVCCRAVYDWGTRLAERWGWVRIARLRERMKPWALPFSQVLLAVLACGCLAAAAFL